MVEPNAPLFELQEIVKSDEHAVLCIAKERSSLAGRRVLLKVVRERVTSVSMLTRVRDEARMLGRLRHPSIVHVYRLHTWNGRPALEMEFLQGVSVSALLERNPNGLPADAATKIARRAAMALDAAYNQPDGADGQPMRVVHRDLNPKNIWVTVDGVVKVIDFTLAKGVFPDRATHSLYLVAGKGGYAAPEMNEGADATHSSDVYSLGLSLYTMLSGAVMRIPRVPGRHDDTIASNLAGLKLDGLSEVVGARLVDLIREMTRFEAHLRVTAGVAVTVLEEVLEAGAVPHGLSQFASIYVEPAWKARVRQPAAEHADYSDVSFVDQLPPDMPDQSGEVFSKEQVEAKIWRIVSQPGWAPRLGELQELMFSTGIRARKPFLAVLERANPPPWKFWQREAPADDVCAALMLLADSDDSAVLDKIRALIDHANPEIKQSARFILKGKASPS